MTKPLATSRLLLALALAILFSCTEIKRDNPLDPDGINFVGYSSSSSDALSSDSSSSGEQDSSSSEDALSSSLDGVSSSSEGSSSSSEALTSSSSGEQGSSSSVEALSSSEGSSSSSGEQSSSSESKECKGIAGNDEFCYDGLFHKRCGGDGGITYTPTIHICQGNRAIIAECNEAPYNPLEHKCDNNILKNRCGISSDKNAYNPNDYNWYDPKTDFCTRSGSEPKVVELCEGRGYDTRAKFCYEDTIYDKCGGNDYDPETHFCDARGEGKSYKYVEIDTQIWMAENLNYEASGSKCGNVLTSTLTDDATDCDKYGRLYNWNTAVCPSGWHLPSNAEWNALIAAAGNLDAGKHLRATSGWNYYNGIANLDSYGFSALPGGSGNYDDNFIGAGESGVWWSASEVDYLEAYTYYISYSTDNVSQNSLFKPFSWLSVRCVRD